MEEIFIKRELDYINILSENLRSFFKKEYKILSEK